MGTERLVRGNRIVHVSLEDWLVVFMDVLCQKISLELFCDMPRDILARRVGIGDPALWCEEK
jgi:hypothetical protein